jgi:hypothetical protein
VPVKPRTQFVLQPDGTLRCPDDKPLYPQEPTRSANGSLRIVYAARISHCRVCPLRKACQGSDKSPHSARRVSAVSQPLTVEGSALVLDSVVPAPAASVEVPAENPPAKGCESGSTPLPSRDLDELVSPPPMSAPKKRTLPVGYGPPVFSARSAHAGFAGTDFSLQPDGTLLCPTKHSLSLLEHRPLSNGSIRIVYAARISACRICPLRGAVPGTGQHPDTCWALVHALCHPLPVPVAPAETEPTPFPVGVNVQTPLEPLEVPSGEIESLPPLASSVPIAPPPTSAPVHVAPMEMEPTPFPVGVNVQTPLEPASAPVEDRP